MTEPVSPTAESILQLCAAAAPNPWYPAQFVRTTGIRREILDPILDQLRMAGLIHLTDWVQDYGQGYALTPQGAYALQNPRTLTRQQTAAAAPLPQNFTPSLAPVEPPPSTWERGEAVRAALLHTTTPIVTLLLIGINILIFLAGAYQASRQGLPINKFLSAANDMRFYTVQHDLGALLPEDIYRDGGWWRLISYCFVHFGLLHLGVNMYTFYVIGPHLEALWGHWRFLALYLIAGIGGGATAVILRPEIMLAGASGALWGAMASEIAWLLLNRRYLPRALVSEWLRQLRSVFILNAFISFLPGISAAAHFGGGAIGFVVGILLNFHRFEHGWRRLLALLGLVMVPVGCVAAIVAVKAELLASLEAQEFPADDTLVGRLRAEEKKRAAYLQSVLDSLLRTEPAKRDARQVAERINQLGKLEVGLRREAQGLAAVQPGTDPEFTRTRADWIRLIGEEAGLCDLARSNLEKGERWTDADEDRLDQQKQRVAILRRRLRLNGG